ncbi:nucleotidyltransferase family protein [Mucilaginibacter sp. RS28]|uniref:Nucleotidyltransferase family protein n=1 Tax=Mucilaginibacter straminoryzae TaxID=2932774 RepID=A0A9X1X5A2_9SPHI|nr:nucleotidyltransferase family protein [Mucilaginibacter straminoryzae]
MIESAEEIAVIILAAGASKRLGQPKQLLTFRGITLIEHAVKTAFSSGCKKLFVVTGAAHFSVAKVLANYPLTIIENPDWEEGIASSIRAGVEAAKKNSAIKGALIMLCDQPLITPQHLENLIITFIANGLVTPVCTSYNHEPGVPALFPATMFAGLLTLRGDEGAKKVLKENQSVQTLSFEEAAIDVDTAEDYQTLLKRLNLGI